MSSPVITPEQLSALPPEMQSVIVALVAHYEGRIAALERDLVATTAELVATQRELAQARKNSATSSKPPSSDLVKPPKPPTPTGAGWPTGAPQARASAVWS